jgi:7-carboxy-7-deazaguanine synthase (Cx14CxxC type)
LWSGRETDRATAFCSFCDTDFVGVDGPGGGRFSSADTLLQAIAALWPSTSPASPFVVCTGGEPLLQLDAALIQALHERGFEIAIETNGTQSPPAGIDWICMSPKAGAELVLRAGDELKLIYPQDGAPPEAFESLDFRHFLLQPMDGPHRARNTQLAIQYCLDHPHWRLSLQTHKYLGIP